ncbi:hypothetical protein LB467_09915 [Salegentibacter sp. JZCK2]|uniref:hypothetical protein n=1 Tax=Salegentibacter tibetensis TaxID=2873600 RepID=UPI001CCEF14B|nr:hypothetical protein [Salegentibacter tibetensis]MBZ9730001.1 hypothetical protein [Salegentibacter tibetensis]
MKSGKDGKQKFYSNISLPREIFTDVDALEGTNIMYNKFLHLLSLLKNGSEKRFGISCHYTFVSSKYLKKVFTTYYSTKVILPLQNAGIIECDGLYSPDTAKCHYYRINPEYFKGQIELERRKFFYKMDLTRDLGEENKQHSEDFELFVNGLEINKNSLDITMNNCLDLVDSESYKYNYNVDANEQDVILVNDGTKTFPAKIWKLVEQSFSTDSSLIQDGLDYYYMTEDKYKELKKNRLKSSWSSSIDNLAEGNFRAYRNKTNYRLDTNLTNLPKELREVVMKDNGLINIDLSNSQFAILSMVMRKDGFDSLDALNFYKASEEGNLYEFIQAELNLENRGEAKQVMFRMLFSSDGFKSENKTKFEKLFPTVAEYISKYKRQYGDNAFSIKLQREESYIFIDGIKPILKDHGISHTTIHDSVICREEDSAMVLDIIDYVFRNKGLNANITIDNPSLKEILVAA